QRQRRREQTNGRWHERCLGLRIRSQFPLFLILRRRVAAIHWQTRARGGGKPTLGPQQGHGPVGAWPPSTSIIRDPFSQRKEGQLFPLEVCTQPSAEPKEDPTVPQLSDLKLRNERRRRCFSSPQESMTTLTEMTLSALAWLVAFAVRYGLSPAVPEMPSVGSGKAKHLRAMTSMLPSLLLRGVAPACKYLLCDTAVHLHLLHAERRHCG
ncbi:hypothetical protein EDB85DRAFT_2035684, partial [Lactarius pseudohatsudake]